MSDWDIGILDVLALVRALLMVRMFHSVDPLNWGDEGSKLYV